ncbi:hypothetical protein [Pedobacter sp.]|uniref:hypothetical protein n=1 Tax=Pedobacter sp. TaxID=1411316 RepID=UPI003C39024A
MTEIIFIENSNAKKEGKLFKAGEVQRFAKERAQEFIDLGVAREVTQADKKEVEKKEEKVAFQTKEEKLQ